MQVSMPSANMSIFRMPSASRSSLSHSMRVRSAIAAFSIGTSSDNGPRVMTKPPTCCDRWRGKADQLAGEVERQAQIAVPGVEPGFAHPLVGDGLARPAPHHAGERGDDVAREAQRLADLADRAAGAVADHRRGEPGAVAAVFLVDVLDDLFAPLMLEIDVDVGRLAPRGADEALEQHIDARRIDRGDAEAIAHRRIGRRAAPLAQDAAAPGEADDVVHGQEIAGVFEPLDQFELVGDQIADLVGDAGWINPSEPSPRGEKYWAAGAQGRRLGLAKTARRRLPRRARRGAACGVMPSGTGSSGYS